MSRKILLVYDDFAEMTRMQGDLMKIGFDIVGIVNEARLGDQLISFYPELVITAGRGGKVSAPSVSQKLKENTRYLGKVIVLLPTTQRPSAEELSRMKVDALLEFPCPMPKLIGVIARLIDMDNDSLLDKYHRARAFEGLPALENPDPPPTPATGRPDRASRYAAALRGIEINPEVTQFERKAIKDRQEKLKKDWDFKGLAALDELRRKFVEALFKK